MENKAQITPDLAVLEKAALNVEKSRREHYNWDELVDFIAGWDYDTIADNLLNLYFAISDSYVRNSENFIFGGDDLGGALFDLKELHLAIKAIGEKEKGVLQLVCAAERV